MGALKSAEFASLGGENYVIYSGVYHKRAEAQKALRRAEEEASRARRWSKSRTVRRVGAGRRLGAAAARKKRRQGRRAEPQQPGAADASSKGSTTPKARSYEENRRTSPTSSRPADDGHPRATASASSAPRALAPQRAAPAAPPVPRAAAGSPGSAVPARRRRPRARAELRRRRDALAEEVTELHWDLGGLAYEMAIRDHFRLDVLVRRAAILQERDAELAEVERLLRMEEEGVAGSCPSCSAPHSRGAVYCWQCGATLMQQPACPATTLARRQDAPTGVMDALLARAGRASPERRRASARGRRPARCASCGSPLDGDQRYCLTCGARAGERSPQLRELHRARSRRGRRRGTRRRRRVAEAPAAPRRRGRARPGAALRGPRISALLVAVLRRLRRADRQRGWRGDGAAPAPAPCGSLAPPSQARHSPARRTARRAPAAKRAEAPEAEPEATPRRQPTPSDAPRRRPADGAGARARTGGGSAERRRAAPPRARLARLATPRS